MRMQTSTTELSIYTVSQNKKEIFAIAIYSKLTVR